MATNMLKTKKNIESISYSAGKSAGETVVVVVVVVHKYPYFACIAEA